ncbi:MAG: hypothetical protein MJE68_11565 [Proteobacteria bacterium]|nr:hypothetical protein [Pseudomonadota bacterium]
MITIENEPFITFENMRPKVLYRADLPELNGSRFVSDGMGNVYEFKDGWEVPAFLSQKKLYEDWGSTFLTPVHTTIKLEF